jgi:hypothetical protein
MVVVVMTLKNDFSYQNRLTNQRSRAPNQPPKKTELQPSQKFLQFNEWKDKWVQLLFQRHVSEEKIAKVVVNGSDR